MGTPHPHKEVIIAWANGAEIEYFSTRIGKWTDCGVAPVWNPDTEYRIKPKPPVKKWRWVARSGSTNDLYITFGYYIDQVDYEKSHPSCLNSLLQKIDSTEKEFYE